MKIAQRVEAIRKGVNKSLIATYEVAVHLKAINDGREYRELGYTTVEHFLKGERLGISKSRFYAWIRIVESFTLAEVKSYHGVHWECLSEVASIPSKDRPRFVKMLLKGMSIRDMRAHIVTYNRDRRAAGTLKFGKTKPVACANALQLANMLDEVLATLPTCPFCTKTKHAPSCRAKQAITEARL